MRAWANILLAAIAVIALVLAWGEPLGYILAVHPSADVGNCEHRGLLPSPGNGSQGDYSACYTR